MPHDLYSTLPPATPPHPVNARVVRFKGMSLAATPKEPWYVREARIQGRMKRDSQRRRERG